ncbi:MAG: penicillin-binding transpeptidase domain-containing protein, partial [Clostridia bacterium]
ITGWTGADGKDTWPKNYGGGGYAGPETLRTAIRQSHNVAAAQVLLNMVGVDRSVDFLQRMGVSRDHIDATPFGLSLGSSGITPLQLAVAYGTIANAGVYQQPISFLGISDTNGNVVYDSHAQQEHRQVFRPATAWMTVDMMKGVISSGTGSKAKISGQTVAGKTGTNSDQRGVTFCGMTGWYASSLWVGHDNYKPLSSKSTGNSSAAPLWQSYMKKIHESKKLEDRDIIEADPAQLGLVKVTTCAVSGQLATDACQNDNKGFGTVTDYWYEPTVPTVNCQMHQAMNVCAQSSMVATPYCPDVVTRGVVVIPNGHPLSAYANDGEYGPVIAEYLGTAGNFSTCPLHWEGYQEQAPSDGSVLYPDAQQLLQNAYDQLATLDPASSLYANIQSAADNLQNVLNNSSAGTADIASAMSVLTQAMAGM